MLDVSSSSSVEHRRYGRPTLSNIPAAALAWPAALHAGARRPGFSGRLALLCSCWL